MHENQRPNSNRHRAAVAAAWIQLIILPSLVVHLVGCNEFAVSPDQHQLIDKKSAVNLAEKNQTLVRVAAEFERDQNQNPKTNTHTNGRKHRATNVSDLRLTADYRAAKLRWIYTKRDDLNSSTDLTVGGHDEPASFDVRYCELTSWNSEIKCRHREMSPEASEHLPTNVDSSSSSSSTVIKTPIAGHCLSVLRRDKQFIEYQAEIFDLRALTNYTFQVKVLRFRGDMLDDGGPFSSSASNNSSSKSVELAKKGRASSSARQLSFIDNESEADNANTNNELAAGRIETKPFRAEASKCLADISEVTVTTGKYFGGRISVEDSADKRCHLIGNKSSEQTSYTFRIDHEICRSKIVKSFTLRASISLPKVNGLMGSSRAAVITQLNGKPTSKEQAVLLGRSMPGIFRAKPALEHDNQKAHSNELPPIATNAVEKTNSIRKFEPEPRSRQAKNLQDQSKATRNLQLHRSRSLELRETGDQPPLAGQQFSPEPVQVQSKVLFVDRQPAADSHLLARITPAVGFADATAAAAAAASASGLSDKSGDGGDSRRLNQTNQQAGNNSEGNELKSTRMQQLVNFDEIDPQETPLIMTNNHRVSSELQPTSGADEQPTIKYSGAKVNEYSIGSSLVEHQSPLAGGANYHSKRGDNQRRTGRVMQNNDSAGDERPLNGWLVTNRMGEMRSLDANNGDLLAETSNTESHVANSQPIPALNQSHYHEQHSNLAQNLTSYLLKWSLRTLANLAKKSLESLANRTSDTSNESMASGEPTTSAEEMTTTTRPIEVLPSSSTTSPQRTMSAAPSNIQQVIRATAVPNPKSPAEISDGFETHSRQRAQTSTQAAASERPQTTNKPINHHRASNYSKSLDLDRHQASSRTRQFGTTTTTTPAAGVPSRAGTSDEQMARSNEGRLKATDDLSSVADVSRSSSSSFSWLLFGGLVLSVLLVSILATLCLVSSYPHLGNSSTMPNSHCASAQLNGVGGGPSFAPKGVSSLPRLIFSRPTMLATSDCGPGVGQSHEALDGGDCLATYEKYDYNRFENHPRRDTKTTLRDVSSSSSSGSVSSAGSSSSTAGSIDGDINCLMHTNKQAQLLSQQVVRSTLANNSRQSNATRSTSIGLSDENNCTNNELLFTEHVLINGHQSNRNYSTSSGSGSGSFNESFA